LLPGLSTPAKNWTLYYGMALKGGDYLNFNANFCG
jgi:hypothetical protein